MKAARKVVLKCDYGTFIEKKAKIYIDGVNGDVLVCGKLLMPAYVAHIGSDEVKLKVIFRDVTGGMKHLHLPISSIASGEHGVNLLRDRGFYVKNKADTAVYLRKLLEFKPPKKKVIVTPVPGWQKPNEQATSLVYVTNGNTIGQDQLATKLELSPEIQAGFKTKGTIADWNEHVGSLCQGNPILQFMVFVAIAGMLLKWSGLPNCGFHMFGPSKSGKTTGIRIASSVYGSEEFIRTWNSTINALEGTAFARNHSLLPLDEIGGGNPKDVEDSIYRLMNGLSRSRLSGESQLVDGKRYVGVVLSNGEHDMAAHLKEAGLKIKPGQLARISSIPIHGPEDVFQDLHGCSNPGELGAAIIAACNEYHGSIAVAMINKAVGYQEKLEQRLPERWRAAKNKLMSKLPESEQGGVHDAVAKSFAMVQVAGERAIKWKVIDWPLVSVTKAVSYCFTRWADHYRGSTAVSEAEILNYYAQFFQSHSATKFIPYEQFETAKSGILAGYTRKIDGVPVFLVYQPYFDRTLSEKYGRSAGLNALRDAGYLMPGSRNTPTRQVTIPKHARADEREKMGFIVIKSSILRHGT